MGRRILRIMFSNWADVGKARNVLGWEPQVNLREACRDSLTGTLPNVRGRAGF